MIMWLRSYLLQHLGVQHISLLRRELASTKEATPPRKFDLLGKVCVQSKIMVVITSQHNWYILVSCPTIEFLCCKEEKIDEGWFQPRFFYPTIAPPDAKVLSYPQLHTQNEGLQRDENWKGVVRHADSRGRDKILYTDLIFPTSPNPKSRVGIGRFAGSDRKEVASRSGKPRGEGLGF